MYFKLSTYECNLFLHLIFGFMRNIKIPKDCNKLNWDKQYKNLQKSSVKVMQTIELNRKHRSFRINHQNWLYK